MHWNKQRNVGPGRERGAAKAAAFAMFVAFTVGPAVSSASAAAPPGATPCAGAFQYRMLDNGDLAIIYDQFPSPNDNSYGVNAVGWGGPGKHTFSNLVGSDKAGFQIRDAGGTVRLSWNLDYISLVDPKKGMAPTPSGYASGGPFAGEGDVLVGTLTPADIVWATSLDRNLNSTGYFTGGTQSAATLPPITNGADLLKDSPATVNNVDDYTLRTPNPWSAVYTNPEYPAAHPLHQVTGWNFHNTYFSVIKAAKLASLGFDAGTWKVEANLTQLHNSPAKSGCVNPPPEYTCLGSTPTGTTTGTIRVRTTDVAMTHVRAVLTPTGGGAAITSATTPLSIGAADIAVSGLSPGTAYGVQVYFLPSAAAANNPATATGSGSCPLTTNAPLFVYECATASAISTTSATISGSTDNPAATQARFTMTPGGAVLTDTTATPAGGRQTFSVNATNLTPGQNYSFVVEFLNSAGGVLGTSAANGCPFVTLVGAPSIDIIKFVNENDADNPPGVLVPSASTLSFKYVVINNGNVALTNVAVSDDKGIAVSCPKNALAVGEAMTCTGTGPAPAAGQYTNVGTVVGTPPAGPNVTDSNPANAFAALPAVKIVKYVNGDDANSPPGKDVPASSTLQFLYVVTNTGNVPLVDLVVTDDKGVAVTCPKATLAVGEVMTCTAAGPAPASGPYKNIGTVTGNGAPTVGPNGQAVPGAPVTDSNPAHVNVPPQIPAAPGILIIKKVNGFDADNAPGVIVPAGSTLTFTYEVYNTGGVPLTGVVVTDSKGVAVTCPTSSLAVATSMVCFGTGPAPASGQYSNVGTVTGNPPSGPPVTDDNPANAFVPAAGVEIVKFVNGADADTPPGLSVPVGAAITWTYRVTNTGNVPLTNVKVTDDKAVAVNCGSGTNTIGALAVGEAKTCVATGVAVLGLYTNIGTVVGTPNPPLLPGQPPVTLPNVTDDNPANYTATPPVAVEPPAEIPEGELPPTGSNSTLLAPIAASLMALGAVLVIAGRRRRARSA